VAAIAIACLAAFLLVRRRQRKQNGLVQAAMSQADLKYTQPAQEYQGDSGQIPQEMQADTTQATELPGAYQYYLPKELPTEPQYPSQS
jgi:hypothetical protein